ncbi:hypothetical protein JCM3770_000974 [Rhodotorula araucariae]
MPDTFPLKRVSPPAAAASFAPALRLTRLALPTPSLADNGHEEPAARVPKIASLFQKPHEREPAPMRRAEAGFVDTQFDVEDAASYQDALLVLEGLANRTSHLTRHQTRLLLSLSLFPLLFRPPEQHSTTVFSSRSLAKPAREQPARTRLLARADDPLVVSHRRLREGARDLLADAMGVQRGGELVGEAVAGYGMPLRGEAGGVALATAEEEEGRGPPRKKAKGKTVGKARAGTGATDRRAEAPHDGEDALTAAANRILDAADLWDVLGGTTARKERLRTKERPLLEVGAWDLMRVLVRAWEDEAERKTSAASEQGEDTPEPLSLLRQFEPSASSSAARELASKVLDVVFWPFVYAAEDGDNSTDESSDDDERGDAAKNGKSRADNVERARERHKEKAEEDGTSLADKREVAVRLMKLIGDSAVHGYLDADSTVSELVQRMKALSQADFLAFLLPATPSSSIFTIRLLTAYLETHSHPPSATAQLHAGPSSSPNSRTITSQPPSPRRLGASATLADATAHARAAYWRVPSLASPAALVALTARIPHEVPLTPAPDGGALPLRAARAAERFEAVKAAVVELLLQREDKAESEQQEAALHGVRAAMVRVQAVRAAGGGEVRRQ